MEHEKPVLVVTGFGPFGIHSKNASWEAVQLLSHMDFEAECDVTLVTKEIPVTYDDVDQIVPKLWQEHEPLLMVHVGVSHGASHLTLESCANRSGYKRIDVKKCKLSHGCNLSGDAEHLKTGINLEEIRSEAESYHSIDFILSDDAGRYLCEYIYYTSLSINRDRTIFIHVPMIKKDYSVLKIAEHIKLIIKLTLKQLRTSNQSDTTCMCIADGSVAEIIAV